MHFFNNFDYSDLAFLNLIKNIQHVPASWSSGNAFVSGAGDLRFKSQAGQIGHSVANGSPPLRHFFKRSCVARAQWRANSLHPSA